MYKIFFLILNLFFWFSFAYANITGTNLSGCNYSGFSLKISGPNVVKVGLLTSYKIDNIKTGVLWQIEKNNKVVVQDKIEKFNYVFKKPGNITIKALFSSGGCVYTLKKDVKIYNKIILLINIKNDFLTDLQLEKKNILIKAFSLDNIDNYLFKISDWIFIPVDEAISIFSKTDVTDLNKKNIVLLTKFSKGFYKKLLIPYVKNFKNIKVYIFDDFDLLNLISTIYKYDSLGTKNLITIKFDQSVYFPLSFLVNKLLQAGVNIKVISTVLIILVGLLVIAFLRQIIGFSVFGVYTPLIFTVLIISFGYKLTLLFFGLSILSNFITYSITKKIYVLYSSKISLNYIIYSIISIITVGLLCNYFTINLGNINNSIILLFFVLPLLTKNLVKEETKIFSKKFILFGLEFIIITSILLSLLHWTILQYILVAYPDLLWVLIVLVIFVGRFSGLQLLEYVRFYPLISKYLYEEE